MQFDIQKKERYIEITPERAVLNIALIEALKSVCTELDSTGSANFMINLELCPQTEDNCIEPLILLAASHYEKGESFVLANVSIALIAAIKKADAIDSLNYAPSTEEAIDIISMEILERDLLDEM